MNELSRHGFMLMSESSSQPVWVHGSATSRYLAVNPACTAYFGYSADEFSVLHHSDVLVQPGPDAGMAVPAAPDPTDEGTGSGLYRLKDGRVAMVTTRSIAIRFEGVPARLCTVETFSDPRSEASGSPSAGTGRHADEIARLKSDLEDRDLFLAQAAHEFRTPLTSILLLAERMVEKAGTDPALDATRIGASEIRQCGETLLRQFDRIIQIARVGAGKLTAEMDRFKVGPLIRSATGTVSAAARHKGVGVRVAVSPEIDEIWADEFMLRQILVNLLANAVEFTPAGKEVMLDVGPCPSGNPRMLVVDQGPGIAPEDHEKLFVPYAQVGIAGRRPGRGSGLGLALVKQFADAQGIGLSVTSIVGAGSRFILVLPPVPPLSGRPEAAASVPSPDVAPPPVTVAMPAMRIRALVVDDNDTNRGLLCDYLVNAGFDAHGASDGPTALTLLSRLRPDVVVMDVQMPHMDGLEATRRIRAMAEPALAATPVLGLTALSMVGDRERCIAAGMTDFRSKPFSLRALAALLRELAAKVPGR